MLFNRKPLFLTEADKKKDVASTDDLEMSPEYEDTNADSEPKENDDDTSEEDKPDDETDTSETSDEDENPENDDNQLSDEEGSEDENSETGDDLGSSTDDGEIPSEIDEKVSENPLKVRNLYEEYKLLYKGISNTIERIGKFSPSTPIEASLLSYIQEALTDLHQKLYFFLTELFTEKGYEENLVTFFSFQAAIASTRELINRLAILDSDNKNS